MTQKWRVALAVHPLFWVLLPHMNRVTYGHRAGAWALSWLCLTIQRDLAV